MDRAAISTKKAPTALVLNSQAIVAGGFVFYLGTVGIDPETGPVRDGIEDATDRDQPGRHLGCRRSLHDQPVKTTIFYVDVEDFPTINTVYSRHMPPTSPFRTIQRRPPRDLLISIDAMAIKTNV